MRVLWLSLAFTEIAVEEWPLVWSWSLHRECKVHPRVHNQIHLNWCGKQRCVGRPASDGLQCTLRRVVGLGAFAMYP
ncbi:hypothetical protein M433DRAFT_165932 [Acidomyces richmondensis BFW]|nr:MAG: hypothetical protein FE78DRAFT_107525 [Acidomyces sp. 'richmondensis']KYG45646.1 hypothetical protein M433DRAFT_165932 [Acidomyces richmondensis BFW]